MPTDPKDVTFGPQQVSAYAVAVIKERHDRPAEGIRTGIASLDDILNPHRPGELRTVLGYTSNYKSGLMNYIARYNARLIMDRNEADRRCVVTVTWEQSVEEQGVTDLAQLGAIDVSKMMRGELTAADWHTLQAAAVRRGALPWWLIGHSSETNARRPRLSMSDLARTLEYIIDVQKIRVDLICLDYLQRIRREGSESIREGFIEIVDRAKDMALAYHCPVMLGAQAGRKVKDKAWRLPGAEDGQETSNLEQSSDSMLSVWMPKNDYPLGTNLEYGDTTYRVSDNMLLVGIVKQKFGQSPRTVELHVKPEVNEIYAVEKRRLNA